MNPVISFESLTGSDFDERRAVNVTPILHAA